MRNRKKTLQQRKNKELVEQEKNKKEKEKLNKEKLKQKQEQKTKITKNTSSGTNIPPLWTKARQKNVISNNSKKEYGILNKLESEVERQKLELGNVLKKYVSPKPLNELIVDQETRVKLDEKHFKLRSKLYSNQILLDSYLANKNDIDNVKLIKVRKEIMKIKKELFVYEPFTQIGTEVWVDIGAFIHDTNEKLLDKTKSSDELLVIKNERDINFEKLIKLYFGMLAFHAENYQWK